MFCHQVDKPLLNEGQNHANQNLLPLCSDTVRYFHFSVYSIQEKEISGSNSEMCFTSLFMRTVLIPFPVIKIHRRFDKQVEH
nr:hypothetical protein [Escherichia coli]